VTSAAPPAGPRPWWRYPLDFLRGFLIGMAELVPGVSGGTVALVTRVYDELIDSAAHVLGAVRALGTADRRRRVPEELRRTDWWLLGPLLVGMATAVLTMAGLMSGFVTGSPEVARGLFLGLVAASVAVPLVILPPREPGTPAYLDPVWVLGAAVVAYVLTSLAGGRVVEDPAWWFVLVCAAVAICALVIPGVSGSFFLLAVGLYVPTLDAIDQRDLGYLAIFAAGALLGLASFVKVLHYLLHHQRRLTLLLMAGFMLGSLRALWPWQGDGAVVDGEAKGTGELLAPYDPVLAPILWALAGAAVVAVLVWWERRRGLDPDLPQPDAATRS